MEHNRLKPSSGFVYVTLSENPRSSRKKKNDLKIICEIMQIFTSIYGASNQQRKPQINNNYIPSYTPIYGEFDFHTLNGECVTCICLQCVRCKQNRYCFLGKTTTTIDKCTISLRVISIAYLFAQSLVNILS